MLWGRGRESMYGHPASGDAQTRPKATEHTLSWVRPKQGHTEHLRWITSADPLACHEVVKTECCREGAPPVANNV